MAGEMEVFQMGREENDNGGGRRWRRRRRLHKAAALVGRVVFLSITISVLVVLELQLGSKVSRKFVTPSTVYNE